MDAINQLAEVFPAEWGATQSRWRRGGHVIAYDNSPFLHHPPDTADDIVSGRITHPIADQVRALQPGESVTIPESTLCDMEPGGAELFSALVRWAMREGGYWWEWTFSGDWKIGRTPASAPVQGER